MIVDRRGSIRWKELEARIFAISKDVGGKVRAILVLVLGGKLFDR